MGPGKGDPPALLPSRAKWKRVSGLGALGTGGTGREGFLGEMA